MTCKTLSLGLIAGLAACSGGSGGAPTQVAKAPTPTPEVTPAPTALAAGRVSSANDASFRGEVSDDAKTITVRIDGNTRTLDVVDTPTKPLRYAFHDGGNMSVTAAIAENKATRVGFATTQVQGDPDAFEARTFVERLGDTTLPMSGKAAFSGGYNGISNGMFLVTGDAELTANFNQGTIRGAITNRQLSDGQNVFDTLSAGDLRLDKTSIDANGAFAGTTSQGDITSEGGTLTSLGGNYHGMITGGKGGRLGGALTTDFTLGEETLHEVGVFLAN